MLSFKKEQHNELNSSFLAQVIEPSKAQLLWGGRRETSASPGSLAPPLIAALRRTRQAELWELWARVIYTTHSS